MDVLALPPPLGRLMQTACASLGRHPLLMDGDSPANFRRGSLQAGNEIRAAARHLLSFGCSASSGLSPPSLLLPSSFSSHSSSPASLFSSSSSLCSFSCSFYPLLSPHPPPLQYINQSPVSLCPPNFSPPVGILFTLHCVCSYFLPSFFGGRSSRSAAP